MWAIPVLCVTCSIIISLTSVLMNKNVNIDNIIHNKYNYIVGTNYSREELYALKQFGPMVTDILKKNYEETHGFLIRWIRACDLDLNCADKMLRKAQKWRKDFNMESILTEHNPVKFDPCIVNGMDNEGSPIIIVRWLKYDIRKLLMGGNERSMTRKGYQCLERAWIKVRELSNVTGKDIRGVILMDAFGYNLKQHGCLQCFNFYFELLRDTQNFYPEALKSFVIVNAPKIAGPLIESGKTIMSSSMLKTFKTFGHDKLEWTSYLLKHIPSNQLPKDFGGTANW